MENINVLEIDFKNNTNKCRICFKLLSPNEHRIQITKGVERKFLEFTQTKLKPSLILSREICVVCNYQLTIFTQAKKNAIDLQRALFKFISKSVKVPDTNEVFQCDLCGIKYCSKEDLVLHFESHHACCNSIFNSYPALNEHRLKDHFKEIKKWFCQNCKQDFSGSATLANHIALYHSTTNVKLLCPANDCSKKCSTRKQLLQHLKSHKDDKQVCAECGIVVGNKHNLTKHIRRIHLKIKNFECDKCDYKGFFKFNIEQHMQTHLNKSERERFNCKKCDFTTISKMSLRTHHRMEHLGQKRIYTCQCGKTFTQSSSFNTHLKVVHDKIKNHVCGFKDCLKAFAEKSQLRNHIKSQHIKQRDHPCSECKKSFYTQKHLRAHLKYHKPPSFTCSVANCTSSFFTSTQLKSHYKVHDDQRDFECPLCEKSYFHRSHLKKHLLKCNQNTRN